MKHALCIGINQYPGTDADLQGCVNDALDWAQALHNRGFSTEMLLNEQATQANMIQRMNDTVTGANYGDTVIITYSGHGTWVPDANGDEPDGRDEALCPHDVFTVGPLTDDYLFSIFTKRNRGAKVVFISDSCNSGSVSRFANFQQQEGPANKVRFMAPEIFLTEQEMMVAKKMPERSRSLPTRTTSLLLSGCRDFEYSYDAYFNGRYNGAFTFTALKALETLPVTATYRDWMTAIRAQLPSQQYPQTPVLTGTWEQRNWKILD